jgi:hypothetical protein
MVAMDAKISEFDIEANALVDDLEEDNMYLAKDISILRTLIVFNKKEFVKMYMKLTGATQWDLSDVIYSKS